MKTINKEQKNIAYIDGQNLYSGTNLDAEPWKVDFYKLRTYLRDKYHVTKALYFMGFVQESQNDLYERIQDAGFILKFREHNPAMIGKKKGNVDVDIVFDVMKRLFTKENFSKVVLISGDGDYKQLVDFLISEKRFEKILFPNRKFASSLYKKVGSEYYDYLWNMRHKIMLK